ncbi:hypothetical protein [Clostridium botulinum]|uniref:hypothetical protein n=1 Tax=Clostridium botulinum TaxID=1491 RepID=UPI001C9AF8B5|nr:hypothetical protein [Clostridium botulinum]MBY6842730.1 hypothetical protein [Clostridium botulinum]
MSVNDFMKLEQLATFTGCMMVTFMFVQVLKDLKPFKQIPTKYLSIVIGILNVIMVSVMQNQFDVTQLYLMIINGTLVGLTATGTYDFKGKKKDDEVQTINNFYETPIVEDTNIVTDTKEFDNIIENQNEIKG